MTKSVSRDPFPDAAPHESILAWLRFWLQTNYPAAHRIVFKSAWSKAIAPFVSLASLSALFASTSSLLRNPSYLPRFIVALDVLHVSVLTLLLLFFVRRIRPAGVRSAAEPTVDGIKQFKTLLYALVFSWILFYALQGISDFAAIDPNTQVPGARGVSGTQTALGLLALFAPIANISSSIVFILMYIALSQDTARGTRAFASGHAFWVSLVIAMACLILAFIAMDVSSWGTVAAITNGLFGGIALALYVARLESKYIGLADGTVIALLLYALIQPLYPYIETVTPDALTQAGLPSQQDSNENEKQEHDAEGSKGDVADRDAAGMSIAAINILGVKYVLLLTAFILKVLLIVSAGWLLDTGVLSFYMEEIRWLDANARAMRGEHISAMSKEVQPMPSPHDLIASLRAEEGPSWLMAKEQVIIPLVFANVGTTSWRIHGFHADDLAVDGKKLKCKTLWFPDSDHIVVGSWQRGVEVDLHLELMSEREEFERIAKSVGEPTGALLTADVLVLVSRGEDGQQQARRLGFINGETTLRIKIPPANV